MPGVKIYDANRVNLLLAGLIIDSGYADDEFCRIEPETDAFIDVAGTDGEVARSKTNDRRVTITVLLLQTSEGNTKLSALHAADLAANNGAGIGPFLIVDKSGLALHSGKCWVAKAPTTVYARGATAREWKLRAVLDVGFNGGS